MVTCPTLRHIYGDDEYYWTNLEYPYQLKHRGSGYKYYRPVRDSYASSILDEMALPRGFKDLIGFFKRFKKTRSYSNVRIDINSRRDHRTPDDWWGKDTYDVLADFDGKVGQLVGYVNFKE